MHSYLCPPKVDLRAFSVTQGVIPLQMQYEGSYCYPLIAKKDFSSVYKVFVLLFISSEGIAFPFLYINICTIQK
jgi:hypothetical protein